MTEKTAFNTERERAQRVTSAVLPAPGVHIPSFSRHLIPLVQCSSRQRCISILRVQFAEAAKRGGLQLPGFTSASFTGWFIEQQRGLSQNNFIQPGLLGKQASSRCYQEVDKRGSRGPVLDQPTASEQARRGRACAQRASKGRSMYILKYSYQKFLG